MAKNSEKTLSPAEMIKSVQTRMSEISDACRTAVLALQVERDAQLEVCQAQIREFRATHAEAFEAARREHAEMAKLLGLGGSTSAPKSYKRPASLTDAAIATVFAAVERGCRRSKDIKAGCEGVDSSDVTDALDFLRNAGRVRTDGEKAGTTYHVVK